MFKRLVGSFLVATCTFGGCAAADDPLTNEEELGSTRQGIAKGRPGAMNGDLNYCANPANPCIAGEGDCDSDAECAPNLLCGLDNGDQFGFGTLHDICVVTHCTNGIQDADETEVDCGGVDCGSDCSEITGQCANVPPNGQSGHCTSSCPCPAQEGDCNADSECSSGSICGLDNGDQFGFGTLIDVCVVPHCSNGVQDADETHVDCGGADCGSDCSEIDDACASVPANGQLNRCTAACPCSAQEGDCNQDAECQSGLVCTQDVGQSFGFGTLIDVCLPGTCDDGVLNGDETQVDCGGSCTPCSGASLWVDGYGGSDDQVPGGVAMDRFGNVIMVGRFRGTINLGGSDLSTTGTSATAWDIYLAKYDLNGNHLWSMSFGGNGGDGDFATDVAVDGSGNIVIVGNYYLTADFGGGASTANGAADIFVAKYDPNGNHVWSRTWGGAGQDYASGVTIDRNGNVVVVANIRESVAFDLGTETSLGDWDIVVLHLTPNGTTTWQRRYGGASRDTAYDVAVDPNRRVYVTGEFFGSSTFGSTTIASAGLQDGFVLRTEANGNMFYVKRFGGTNVDRGVGVTANSASLPTVTGLYSSGADLGFGALTTQGGTDAFVLGLDYWGAPRWQSTFGGATNDEGTGAVVASNGDLIVTGYVNGSVANFPSGATTAFGGTDAFLLRYTSAGAVVSGSTHGGSGGDRGVALSRPSTGSIGVGWTGFFSSSANIGGAALTSAGLRDIFVGRLAD